MGEKRPTQGFHQGQSQLRHKVDAPELPEEGKAGCSRESEQHLVRRTNLEAKRKLSLTSSDNRKLFSFEFCIQPNYLKVRVKKRKTGIFRDVNPQRLVQNGLGAK